MGALGVPAFYLRGELIIGYVSADTTGGRIKSLLDSPAAVRESTMPEGACAPDVTLPCGQESAGQFRTPEAVDTPFLGRLSVRELGLLAFTVALGLLDGFNPCAMWVLLFLLSLLVNLQDRVKMLLIAGTFVAVSGLSTSRSWQPGSTSSYSLASHGRRRWCSVGSPAWWA